VKVFSYGRFSYQQPTVLLRANYVKQHLSSSVSKHFSAWRFHRFEREIHSATWARHEKILHWAEMCAKNAKETADNFKNSADPVVRLGYELRQRALANFKNKLKHIAGLRVLVHTPDSSHSPGGFSVFNNLIQSLNFLGVPTTSIPFDGSTRQYLYRFRPTVLISSDHQSYLGRIDWTEIEKYRATNPLQVGLTASLREYGNTALTERLRWAKAHGVDFYYSFRSPEYLRERKEYRPFFEDGYEIVSVEFGANILQYYPVPGITRDLSYVFLASSNSDKWSRYHRYLTRIFKKYPGFIDGPGWRRVARWAPQDTHRYLYARAKVGINLHIADSINWASELNERTYILAACGVPQLVDAAKLLGKRFGADSVFSAHSPRGYNELFGEMLENPEEGMKRALRALCDVYERHTTFHRAEEFAVRITSMGK